LSCSSKYSRNSLVSTHSLMWYSLLRSLEEHPSKYQLNCFLIKPVLSHSILSRNSTKCLIVNHSMMSLQISRFRYWNASNRTAPSIRSYRHRVEISLLIIWSYPSPLSILWLIELYESAFSSNNLVSIFRSYSNNGSV
jgi:hypothetical protein